MQLNTNTTLSSLLDKYAPIVTKLSRRQSPSKPWFSTNLCAFLSTLRHAENIWKRTQSAADWSSFKSLRNQYHKLIASSYNQPPITPNVFGKQSTNSYTANLPHRYPPLLLALYLQTALLLVSQAKYPNSAFLTPAAQPHHLRTHPLLLPPSCHSPGFLSLHPCFEIRNPQDPVQLSQQAI